MSRDEGRCAASIPNNPQKSLSGLTMVIVIPSQNIQEILYYCGAG